MDNVEGWPWLPQLCPPDMYFIDWMKERQFAKSTVLHMGTGLHHRVGIECCAMGHSVIGLTVSKEEAISRVFRVEAANYQVLYANLNELDLALIPPLDIMTLFHFGEMDSVFGPANYDVLCTLVQDHLADEGYVLFYARSAGWGSNAKAVVARAVDAGVIRHDSTYEELEVYVKC